MSAINIDFPNYSRNNNEPDQTHENYHEELNQTLRQKIGNNGFWVTNITNTDLTTTPIINPDTGQFTTVMDLANIGTVWFVVDASPPIWVGKQSDSPTVLVKFTVSSYP